MITVFYANQVYGQYANSQELKEANLHLNGELIDGGIFYDSRPNYGWYTFPRGECIPEDQIDPQLKAWILLLE